MLESLNIYSPHYERIVIKKINNIVFFLLNYSQSFCFNNVTISKFKNFFVHSYIIFFLKLVWRGKAYRIRYFKKNNKFTFNFGHSHWLKLIFSPKNFNFFKIRRQSYLIIFSNRADVSFLINNFSILRTMNKYTKRGIRIKTSPYIKRFGKISQVNSSLHSFG